MVKKNDSFEVVPIRTFLSGDREKSKGFIREANKMLFQVKNLQNSGFLGKVLKHKYEDGTTIKVVTDVGGVDQVYITSRSGGVVSPWEKQSERTVPVPIILAYEICTAASDPVGGFVAKEFSGMKFEYVKKNKDDKIEYTREGIKLKELERVGVYDLIDYDDTSDFDRWWTQNEPADESWPPYDSTPPNPGCGEDWIYLLSDPWGMNSEYWPPEYTVPIYYPFIHSLGEVAPTFEMAAVCVGPGGTEYFVGDVYNGTGSLTSSEFTFTAWGEFELEYHVWSTGAVERDISHCVGTGSGWCSANGITGMTTNSDTSVYSGSQDSIGATCGTDAWMDCSAYWPDADKYIMGISGLEYFSCTVDLSQGPFSVYEDAADHSTLQYGYVYDYKNYASVLTSSRDIIVWESQLYDYDNTDSNGTSDGWWWYFTTVDIFSYKGTPFYMYSFIAYNDEVEDQSIIQYGMIYKDEHYAIKFPALLSGNYAYHTFDTAIVINNKNEEETITLPKDMKDLFGAPDYNNHCVRAGKYTLTEKSSGQI